MNKFFFPVCAVLILNACGTTGLQKVPQPPKSNSTDQKTGTSFTYSPEGKKQFAFAEMSEGLQKFGYGDLCFEMPTRSYANDCLLNKLPYDKYVGKKGFYTDRKPFKDYSGYVVQEAVLETGEVIYLATSTKYKHVGNKIVPLAEYEKIVNFKPEPIYKGAEVLLTGYNKTSKGYINVSSQKNHSFTEREIEAIRSIASKYPNNGSKIADLLTTLIVDYDDFEGRTIVYAPPYNNRKSYLSIKIIFKDSGEVYPFVVSHYQADDWLFVNGYSISADGYRWDSPKLDFKRDHSGGTIWEWANQSLTPSYINVLTKMANADKAKIRFRGQEYYSDYELSAAQKTELSNLLKIVDLTQK